MRVGQIVAVEDFPEARKPAWKLTIDFGEELGTKRSSAQITNYTREDARGPADRRRRELPAAPDRSRAFRGARARRLRRGGPCDPARARRRRAARRENSLTGAGGLAGTTRRLRGRRRRLDLRRGRDDGGGRRLGRRGLLGRGRGGRVGLRGRRRRDDGELRAGRRRRRGLRGGRREGARARLGGALRVGRQRGGVAAAALGGGSAGGRRRGGAGGRRRGAGVRGGARGGVAVALGSVSLRRPDRRDLALGRGSVGCGAEATGTGGGSRAAAGAAAAFFGAACATCSLGARGSVTCLTSTAPAVTIAAAARPAAALDAIAPNADLQRGRPRRPSPRPAPPAAAAPPPAAAAVPRWATSSFLSSSSGPTGKMAASACWSRAGACGSGAAVAGAQVAADRRGRARRPSATSPSSIADLLAREQARLGGLGQRDAGAHEQRLHRRDRGLHRLGDLLVGERVDLAQQQRGALRLRQVLHVGDQQPELLALVHLVGGREAALGQVDVHRVHADRLRARRWLSERLRAIRYSHGRTLISRSSASIALKAAAKTSCSTSSASSRDDEHVPAERQQPRLIARHQRLEGAVVAAPDQGDEALIGLQAQQRRAAVKAGVL